MSNKNQLTNVVGAYSVSMSGGVNALSYADIMNANSPYKVSDSAKAHLLAIKEGNAEQTGATFKIGYHLAELTKGENPEYKKMGYPSIKALAVGMFDMNEVTAYAWADTASRFVEYDANTGNYHSIFAVEENGKTYDFTMSQLQEMRFPIDKKTGKEVIDLSVWKTMCPALINVKTTTKDIRMVKGCICALAKAKAELTVKNVSELWVKAERLSMSPDKALPYNEQAQPTQAQPTQAQPTQEQPTQAQAQPTQAQPTQAQAQPTQAQAQPTQEQPEQAQPTQAQPEQTVDKVTSRCAITVDGMVITPGYIATAIQSGVLNTTIKAVLEPFAQYALRSEVCRNALAECIDCIREFIEQNMEQAQPEQAQPEQAQPEQAEPEQAEPEQAEPEQAEPVKPIANNSKGKGKKANS